MKKWKCHKVVEAEKIVKIEEHYSVEKDMTLVHLMLDNEEYVSKYSHSGLFARGKPAVGDYLVKYEDDYLSWSPAKAFEEGYSPLEVL